MRQPPIQRIKSILNAAIVLAERPGGLFALTRENIADQARCAPALVSHYYGSMETIRKQVISAAIHTENFIIIAQAIMLNAPEISTLSKAFKRKALESVL